MKTYRLYEIDTESGTVVNSYPVSEFGEVAERYSTMSTSQGYSPALFIATPEEMEEYECGSIPFAETCRVVLYPSDHGERHHNEARKNWNRCWEELGLGETGYQCPECSCKDDFTLTCEGIFTIRRRTDHPDEVTVNYTYRTESVSCTECEYTGGLEEFKKEE